MRLSRDQGQAVTPGTDDRPASRRAALPVRVYATVRTGQADSVPSWASGHPNLASGHPNLPM
jgi:hypothetical protein